MSEHPNTLAVSDAIVTALAPYGNSPLSCLNADVLNQILGYVRDQADRDQTDQIDRDRKATLFVQYAQHPGGFDLFSECMVRHYLGRPRRNNLHDHSTTPTTLEDFNTALDLYTQDHTSTDVWMDGYTRRWKQFPLETIPRL